MALIELRGIEVAEMHNLLNETVAIPQAKAWILDQQVVPDQVGVGLIGELRSYLEGLANRELAEVLIGGLSYGYFSSRDLLKLGFLLTLVECAVLLLLVFFYWPLIGIR